ncbi:hypothetical protein ABID62_003713 [Bradyrhizobium sp. S3.9.1]
MIVPESRHVAVNGGGWRARSLPIVIASVATCPPKLQRRRKQSRIPPRKGSGLLRCARNDGARGIGVVLQIPLSFPATRLRQGFAGAEVQGRRSFSVGGKRGIQYAAASRLNPVSGMLDRPVKPGDDSECCRRTIAFSRRISPELCFVVPPSKPRGRREGRVLTSHPRSAARKVAQGNRTAAYRWCRSLGLPCAMVGRLMPCSPGSRVPSGLPHACESHRHRAG